MPNFAQVQLRIYNRALGHLGERRLGKVDENRESRRVLDDNWSEVVQHCLEMGAWVFACRVDRLEVDTSVRQPDFGYRNAFAKPEDWVRTVLVSESEFLDPPLLRYREEQNHWYAECDPLYVKFVSRLGTYGLDLSRWPQLFEDYVAVRLALQACPRISGAESRAEILRKQERRALAAAREHDAAAMPPQFMPGGTWARSRAGVAGSRWDRRSF
jgi:hypothetical protein